MISAPPLTRLPKTALGIFTHPNCKGLICPNCRPGLSVGSITFKPSQVKLKEGVANSLLYCTFEIGFSKGRTTFLKIDGEKLCFEVNPIPVNVHNQKFAKLKLKHKRKIMPDEIVGKAQIPIAQIVYQGNWAEWIPLSTKHEIFGEIYIEMTFLPRL